MRLMDNSEQRSLVGLDYHVAILVAQLYDVLRRADQLFGWQDPSIRGIDYEVVRDLVRGTRVAFRPHAWRQGFIAFRLYWRDSAEGTIMISFPSNSKFAVRQATLEFDGLHGWGQTNDDGGRELLKKANLLK